MWDFPLNGLSGGQVQFYIRDPSGNPIEINCADIRVLSAHIRSGVNHLSERVSQDGGNMRARPDLAQRASA
jgi:hypothetical protein